MMDNNKTACAASWTCTWCGSVADNATVNTCYYAGDMENLCLKERVGMLVDAAGRMKPMSEWASARWTNMKTWGNNFCGKHTADATKTTEEHQASCDGDKKCYFCDTDDECYVYGSVNSPCGTYQQGEQKMVDKWNSMFGKDGACATSVSDAYDTMKQGSDLSKRNLEEACKEFAQSEVYASRSFAALQSDLGTAASAAADVASMQVAKAKAALSDAALAVNESMETNRSIIAFEDVNTCVKIVSASRKSTQTNFCILVAAVLPFLAGLSFLAA